jgi:hypothetical protein
MSELASSTPASSGDTAPAPSGDGAPIDLDRVRREIDEEVRARRAAGDFPADMERELDLAFARVSPAATTGSDLRGLLQAADRAAFIDPHPPTGSRVPLLEVVKRTERKLLGWYFNYLAQQLTTFAGAAVRALQVLTDRLERVEQALPRAGDPGIGRAAAGPLAPEVATFVVAAFAGVEGRVLVAGEDRGLLEALVADGVDAYGVAAGDERLSASGAPSSAERRDADPLDHLARLAPDSLGGLVLLGLDPLATATKLAFVELAADALVDGGRLAVAGARPELWGTANPIEADLALGRPLRPETWSAVMAARGFGGITVADGADGHVVTATLRR